MSELIMVSKREQQEREVYQLFNMNLRWWATQMPVTIYEPTEEEIFEKTPAELRHLLDNTLHPQYSLDELGLAVITDQCQGTPAVHRASWSVATSMAWAEEQRDLYMQPAYQSLRRAFGIDYHWVFRIESDDEWLHEDDTFLNEHITFDQQGKPEVWICDLSHNPMNYLSVYAYMLRVNQYYPSPEEVIAAVTPFFPDLVTSSISLQSLLEAVGIVVIQDIGQGHDPKRLSWSMALSYVEADQQLVKYQQPAYSGIREALGIDYQWIFLVPKPDEILSYTREPLIQGTGDFYSVDRPECWILDRFGAAYLRQKELVSGESDELDSVELKDLSDREKVIAAFRKIV